MGRSPGTNLVGLPPPSAWRKQEVPTGSVSCGAKNEQENLTTHQPNTEVSMRANSTDTIRNLVDTIVPTSVVTDGNDGAGN